MAQFAFGNRYCFDTNCIIHLKYYRARTFKKLWESVESLIRNGEIISCQEVLKELRACDEKSDSILIWAEQHKEMFLQLNEEHQQHLITILKKFPHLAKPKKPKPFEADPILIAVAISEGCVVVSNELPGKQAGQEKIPDVCKHYGIKCINWDGFLEEKKWEF